LDLVQGALQWLEDNQDKPLEEIKADKKIGSTEDDPTALPPDLKEGEVARSLVCNDCGKRLRSHAQAELHAEKR
jgi:UBX domain-containing protein 1/4